MMDENYIWIAKGFVVSSNPMMDISEFIKESDNILLEVISPLIRNLQQKRILKRWYSGRSSPRPRIPYWRARSYFEISEKNKEFVLRIIDQKAKKLEVIDEFNPIDSNSNFDILQRTSEIALKLLPKIQYIDRNSEEFLKEIDKIVENYKEIQNNEGIHWLENNLGYETNFLGKRYNQIGIIQKLW